MMIRVRMANDDEDGDDDGDDDNYNAFDDTPR